MTDNIYLLLIIGMFGSALFVFSFIFINIRNRNSLQRKKRELQKAIMRHQEDLLYAAINSQEEERKRIGTDLHDEVGSALSTMRIYIQHFTEQQQAGPASEFGNRCKMMIDTIIHNTRNIAHDLSPFTSGVYNILDALEDLCDKVNLSGKPHMSLSCSDENIFNKLEPAHSLALYRVICELVKNTITHADAGNILIKIREEGRILYLQYKDDGKGLTTSSDWKGMGINNIESRLSMIGAVFSIQTTPGKGFEFEIKIPVK